MSPAQHVLLSVWRQVSLIERDPLFAQAIDHRSESLTPLPAQTLQGDCQRPGIERDKVAEQM